MPPKNPPAKKKPMPAKQKFAVKQANDAMVDANMRKAAAKHRKTRVR